MYRVIFAYPLSIPKPIDGYVVKWELYRNDRFKLDSVLDKYEDLKPIIVATEQEPEMLNYFHKINGIILKYGGVTSHIAIVGREYGLPIYRFDRVEKLQDGELIQVLPYQPSKVEIPSKLTFTLRKIIRKGTLEEKLIHVDRTIELFKKEAEPYTEYGLQIKLDKVKQVDENTFLIYIILDNWNTFIENILQDPQSFIRTVEKYPTLATSFICASVSETLYDILLFEVGIRAYLLLRGIKPYWLEAPLQYMYARYGRPVRIKKTPSLTIIKPMDEKEVEEMIQRNKRIQYMAEIIRACIKAYEDKNRRMYGTNS